MPTILSGFVLLILSSAAASVSRKTVDPVRSSSPSLTTRAHLFPATQPLFRTIVRLGGGSLKRRAPQDIPLDTPPGPAVVAAATTSATTSVTTLTIGPRGLLLLAGAIYGTYPVLLRVRAVPIRPSRPFLTHPCPAPNAACRPTRSSASNRSQPRSSHSFAISSSLYSRRSSEHSALFSPAEASLRHRPLQMRTRATAK